MGKPDDWMPLRLQIWRSGTAFMMPEARGPYLDLILAYWELGPLPNDDSVLQSNARVADTKLWRRIRQQVVAKFKERDGVLYHERCDTERAIASQLYERKASAGRVGGQASAQARAKQKASKDEATVERLLEAEGQANGNTTNLEHSAVAENSSSLRSDETRAPKPKGSRLAPDWKPSPDDRAYALGRNLTDAETDDFAEQFREYWTSPDCPKPVKRDWAGTWRRWIARDAASVIARRPRHDGPTNGRAQPRQSVTAARDSILAKAGLHPRGNAETLHPYAQRGRSGEPMGEGDPGRIIEADGWREVPGPADGDEGADPAVTGIDGGPGSTARGVPETHHGIPGGRGQACAHDATGIQPVVAGMGGTEGAVGDSHLPTANDAASADDYGVIPAFLQRSA